MKIGHFQRVSCIIDTCSILTLSDIEIGNKSVLEVLRRYFNISVSDSIPPEFERHQEKAKGSDAQYWKRFLRSNVVETEHLNDDQTVLSHFYTTAPAVWGANDAGERGNARVSAELLLGRTAGHVVFITDDRNSRRGFLDRLATSFPGIKIWDSCDVVLYLGSFLLAEKRVTDHELKGVIRDTIAGVSSWPQLWFSGTQDRKDALIQLFKEKTDMLSRLKGVANCW